MSDNPYLRLRPLVTGGGAYAEMTPDDAEAALNAPVDGQPEYQDVLISDVEGYLAARLLLVGLQDWIATAEPGAAKQAARQLMQIIEGRRLRVFLTSDATRRATVLGMFQGLCAAGAAGLTADHYADIAAMTVKPGPRTTPRQQIGWPGPRIWAADVISARAMEG